MGLAGQTTIIYTITILCNVNPLLRFVCNNIIEVQIPRDELLYIAYKTRDWLITTPIVSMNTIFNMPQELYECLPWPFENHVVVVNLCVVYRHKPCKEGVYHIYNTMYS